MNDKTLIKILLTILILIVLYSIYCLYNKCVNRKTYKNIDTTIKLNRKNELLSKDLFQTTNNSVTEPVNSYNIMDFIGLNNVKFKLTDTRARVYYEIDSNIKFKQNHESDTDDHFIFKNNKLEWVEDGGPKPLHLKNQNLEYFKTVKTKTNLPIHDFNQETIKSHLNWKNITWSKHATNDDFDWVVQDFGITMDAIYRDLNFLNSEKTLVDEVIFDTNYDDDDDDWISDFEYISTYTDDKEKYFISGETYYNLRTTNDIIFNNKRAENIFDSNGQYIDQRLYGSDSQPTELSKRLAGYETKNKYLPFELKNVKNIPNYTDKLKDAKLDYEFKKVNVNVNTFHIKLKSNDPDIHYYDNNGEQITPGSDTFKNIAGVILPVNQKLIVTYKKKSHILNDSGTMLIDKIYDDENEYVADIIHNNYLLNNYLYHTSDDIDYNLLEANSYISNLSSTNITSVGWLSQDKGKKSDIPDKIGKALTEVIGFYIKKVVAIKHAQHNIPYSDQKPYVYEITNIDEQYVDSYLSVVEDTSRVRVKVIKNDIDDTRDATEFKIQIITNTIMSNSESGAKTILIFDTNNKNNIYNIEYYNDSVIIKSTNYDINNENNLNKEYNIQLTYNNTDKHYKFTNDSYSKTKLYFIEPIGAEYRDSVNLFFILYINEDTNELKFLKKTSTDEGVILSNEFINNDYSYLFLVTNYEEKFINTTNLDTFQNTNTSDLEQYKFKPIIPIIDNTLDIGEFIIKSNLVRYVSGIYSKDTYLLLSNTNTVINSISGESVLMRSNLNFEKNNSLFKKIHVVNEEGKLQTKKIEIVSPNITESQTIELSDYGDITFNVFQSSNNQLTYNEIPGIYNNTNNNNKFIIRNDNNGYILHCSYYINNNHVNEGYMFEYFPTIKFYSIYKNGILQKSHSPFFNILNTQPKQFKFIITDYEKHIYEDKAYEKEFKGHLYTTDETINDTTDETINDTTYETINDNTNAYVYYKDYEYYNVQNIYNRTQRHNNVKISISSFKMILDYPNSIDILNDSDKIENIPKHIKYKIEPTDADKQYMKASELYRFEYESDISSKSHKYYNDTIDYNNELALNDYIRDYNIKYKTNLISEIDKLNTSIEKLKKQKQHTEIESKLKLKNLQTYKDIAIKTIKDTILPLQRNILNKINGIYNTNIDIEKIIYQSQNKIKFLFSLKHNKDGLEFIKNKIKELKQTMFILHKKLKTEQLTNFNNLMIINEHIINIDKNVIEINSYLSNNKTIREYFAGSNNKTSEASSESSAASTAASSSNTLTIPSGPTNDDNTGIDTSTLFSNIDEFNDEQQSIYGETQTDNSNNSTDERLDESIIELTKLIKLKANEKYKITKEIGLNNKINDYYDLLITVYKNKHITPANKGIYLNTIEYQNIGSNNYGKILGDLIIKLDQLNIEYSSHHQNLNDKLIRERSNLENAQFKSVNFELNPVMLQYFELEYLELQDSINKMNQTINNVNKLKYIKKKLKQIEQIKIDVMNENVDNYNVFEGFTTNRSNNNNNNNQLTKRFKTIQSHNDEFISVLPQQNTKEYKININGNCLSSYQNNEYDLKECSNSQSQYFEPRLISSGLQSESINKDTLINKNDVEFPYYQMVSSLSRDCLDLNKEHVSITPCNSNNKNQRFNLIENELKCMDN